MICTTKDQYIVNYQETYPCWVVTLSSGLVVFQDDFRPGIEPHSAWERLYHYCHANDDYISKMIVRFRSNVQSLPENADGYYFSKGVRAGIYAVRTLHLFFTGTLNNGLLEVQCWKVPEMIPELIEERDPHKAGLCLISKDIPPI